jgi:exocyst complex component 4
MSVIRTLSASESNEQRDREKAKLEKEYKRSDQKLDELVSVHDQDVTQVMQVGICSIFESVHMIL